VVTHIDPGDRSFPHADSGPSVPSDQAAKELEHVGVVPDNQNPVAVGVLG
jgi:hypothetical protein